MKRYLLSVVFVAMTALAHAQLEEDFDPAPSGWILSQGANFNAVNNNVVIQTPGVGGNNPANIGTPPVSKTSNTVKVCFDIYAYKKVNGNDQAVPFPCDSYADILFVKSTVETSNQAEVPDSIYARQDNYLLPTNGGTTCFTFTFPAVVTASDFKVFISFKAGCGQGSIKYHIDNVKISGVQELCAETNCAPEALNDVFNRGNGLETSFSGALYGSNLNYPVSSNVDAGGTDNDQNDAYTDLKWELVTPPLVSKGSVIINSDGTFTVTRTSTTVTELSFTYRMMDNGPDNDINTSADNMYDEATVTITWPAASTLPVALVNFNGSRNGNYVTLQWRTNMESNNNGFEIQRSTGNGVYEKVGFVASKAPDGNSSVPLYYQFKETNMAKANSWYRIMQIDKDGKSTVTPVKGVRGLEEISKLTVYPNPGKAGNMNVLFGSSAVRDIIIADLGGRTIKQWNNYNEDNMVLSGLKAGVYMLMVNNRATSERMVQKIVVL
ncbi:T9SS type A sorting domain-containing protein [Longitalea luteola]|uniref:T9SS type A sorting domain-containing protein n=1 Tax=Longitalea luteola TaxID=2812563 RepID=UPI001A974EEA|nr:T9SS type A sorting domain-containing protein [Longitalea luteola]